MASESETMSFLEMLINSRNRDLSHIIPFLLGFTTSISDPDAPRVESAETTTNPDDNSGNRPSPDESTHPERIILFNTLTQGMVVMEGTGLDSLFRGAQSKRGDPPASRSAVEAMPRVEIGEGEEGGECVICLEEYSVGSIVKKMPCQHGFHEGCIEKWLGIHGSCPVCRYKMPVDQNDDKKSEERESGGDEGGRVNREIRVRISFGGGRRRGSGGDNFVSVDGHQSESDDRTVENESDHVEN